VERDLPDAEGVAGPRPYARSVLTRRFRERMTDLGMIWRATCALYLNRDIETLTWQQIVAFPDLVAEIKNDTIPGLPVEALPLPASRSVPRRRSCGPRRDYSDPVPPLVRIGSGGVVRHGRMHPCCAGR